MATKSARYGDLSDGVVDGGGAVVRGRFTTGAGGGSGRAPARKAKASPAPKPPGSGAPASAWAADVPAFA